MSLGLAELRCYLVVVRAIQRDRNGGKLSFRQIAQRAGLKSLGHVHAVMDDLVERGMLACEVTPGRMASYRLARPWRNCSAGVEQPEAEAVSNRSAGEEQLAMALRNNCSTGAEQSMPTASPAPEQHCSAGVERNCSAGVEQHLESSEYSELSSSSTQKAGRFEDPATNEAPATTTTNAPQANLQPAPHQWTTEEIQQARCAMQQLLAKHQPGKARLLPDFELTRDVLAFTEGPHDLRLWLWDIEVRQVKLRGYALFRSDSRTWPERRADVRLQRLAMEAKTQAITEEFERERQAIAEVDAAACREFERERQVRRKFIEAARARGWRPVQPNSSCPGCYGFGLRDLETAEVCECEAGRKLERERSWCDRCANTGLVTMPDDPHLAAWCDCEHAAQRRALEPNLVADDNKLRLALISATAKPAAPAPTQRHNARQARSPRVDPGIRAAVQATTAWRERAR